MSNFNLFEENTSILEDLIPPEIGFCDYIDLLVNGQSGLEG